MLRKMSNTLYFSLLPNDLIPPLFLYLAAKDLHSLLPQLKSNREFEKLFHSMIFWKTLWRRDVSKFRLPSTTAEAYKDYIDVFNKLREFTKDPTFETLFNALKYYEKKGYELILYDIATQPTLIRHVLDAAAENNYLDIMEHFKSKINKTVANELLITAAARGRIDAVKFLLQHGADDYARAMTSARLNRQNEMVKFISNHAFNKSL